MLDFDLVILCLKKGRPTVFQASSVYGARHLPIQRKQNAKRSNSSRSQLSTMRLMLMDGSLVACLTGGQTWASVRSFRKSAANSSKVKARSTPSLRYQVRSVNLPEEKNFQEGFINNFMKQ